jgi:hypothetical protein
MFQRPHSYNRGVRTALLLIALLGLYGCAGSQDKEAVHQGILDHLAEAGFANQNMDVTVTSVEFNGDKADAVVQIAAKGQPQGMQMRYNLQQKGSRWVVVGRADSGAGHGASMAPGVANPHGGGALPGTGSGQKMPSPEDLPPSGKKQQ